MVISCSAACSLRAASVPVTARRLPRPRRALARPAIAASSSATDRRMDASIAPLRRTVEPPSASTATTLEGTPPRTGPSSMTTATEAPSAATSSAAVRASGSPERLAEVTASGPRSRASARGTAWSGMRTPSEPRPPVSASGRTDAGRRSGSASVSGAGPEPLREAARHGRGRPRARRPGRARRAGAGCPCPAARRLAASTGARASVGAARRRRRRSRWARRRCHPARSAAAATVDGLPVVGGQDGAGADVGRGRRPLVAAVRHRRRSTTATRGAPAEVGVDAHAPARQDCSATAADDRVGLVGADLEEGGAARARAPPAARQQPPDDAPARRRLRRARATGSKLAATGQLRHAWRPGCTGGWPRAGRPGRGDGSASQRSPCAKSTRSASAVARRVHRSPPRWPRRRRR